MSDLIIPVDFAHVVHHFVDTNVNKGGSISYGVDRSAQTVSNADCANELDSLWKSVWDSFTDTSVSLDSTTVTFGNDGPPIIVESTNPPVNGTVNVESPPLNYATLITKRSDFGGRQFRGRMFFYGLASEGQVNEGGVLDSARAAALQVPADVWRDELETAAGGSGDPPTDPLPMVILHTTPLTGPAPAPTPVTALLVRLYGGTQRRRMVRIV